MGQGNTVADDVTGIGISPRLEDFLNLGFVLIIKGNVEFITHGLSPELDNLPGCSALYVRGEAFPTPRQNIVNSLLIEPTPQKMSMSIGL